ncbi:5-formyltetrahydrofolate cyclo-ligase [Rickettsia endosymbiont of Cardiosporidium cionae]|uniref:5-formyltetrahydrofolate cyclo-ligase n=1 Tax=Rickettsia endosymbiont of Cardiosporidium cionae TaxID=2777155 RepID=UPI0018942D7D|nr:5-formyltetrahydrofolate cyclo-ligase [Rickettsia endosymbiont of Cardiosporidium cionae]KAF8818130.1 5-formyltetrahydrofolate cyclo-ligase [Rickettsia endosymbiont of Cardiosporidium cionae]
MTNVTSKECLRSSIIEQRKSFDVQDYILSNNQIHSNISKIIIKISKKYKRNESKKCNLGIYYPLKGEPDLTKLYLLEDFKIALPKIVNSKMLMIQLKSESILEQNKPYNILSPRSGQEIIPDILVLPGLAFSIRGYRLGFGSAHYDKYIANLKLEKQNITVIGVCFHEMLLEKFNHETHDIMCDLIITDKTIIKY